VTAFEFGRSFGSNLTRGQVVVVSRDEDPETCELASGVISGLRSIGATVEYLAVVSRALLRTVTRSAQGRVHVHVGARSMTIRC
jgi:hypothetical protein